MDLKEVYDKLMSQYGQVSERALSREAGISRHRAGKFIAALPDEPLIRPIEDNMLEAQIRDCKTPEQLAEVFDVDLERYEISEFRGGFWAGNAQTRGTWRLKQDVATAEMVEAAVRKAIDGILAGTELPEIAPVEAPADGFKLVIQIADLHIGKRAWVQATGENYDIETACSLYVQALNYHISRFKGMPINEVVLITGNDLMNTDGMFATTTKGTPQDNCGTWQEIWDKTLNLLLLTTREIRKMYPVRHIIVPGNHDYVAMTHMGYTLNGFFHEDEQVIVDYRPTQRKYYQFGSNLLMFTHGNAEKQAELAQIAMAEQRAEFARSKHITAFLGHLHHLAVKKGLATKENDGMVIRSARSLSGADLYHNAKGYVTGQRGSEAYLIDPNNGVVLVSEQTL